MTRCAVDSRPRDLATLARSEIENHYKLYKAFYSLPSFTWGKTLGSNQDITQANRNPILGVVPGADGLKTGHTDEAGYGFTGSAEPQEIKLIDTATGSRPLLKLLQKLRDGDAANNIPANPDFKIIIRADKEMGYRFLAPVLEQCMLAKVKNVNFNTVKAAE